MEGMDLRQELRQQLKLTPQLLQSMEVLQMNSQELLDYLGRLTEENPVLEREDSAPDLQRAYEELRRRAGWIDGGFSGGAGAGGETVERGAADHRLESLPAFLRDQLERKRLPRPLLALACYLAELVDGDGYLSEEDLEGLGALKIPAELTEQALELLQSLEPAGVGGRSLSECLCLQLDRLPGAPEAARRIAEAHLEALGKKRYGAIARALGISAAEVRAAAEVIAGLEPRPGQAFQPPEPPAYVRPDVFVLEEGGELQVVLNEYYLPRITISSTYVRLLKDSDEAETRAYLQDKLRQAKWLLNCLDRRGSTLRRCAQAAVEAQRAFFLGRTRELAPMSLTALSRALELHPSTVSRAVRDKYLQCRQGTFPLRDFFSRAVGDLSRQAVKRRLAELVRDEDPARPLSDRELSVLLGQGGAEVARRTVAKYRGELGLPSASARRAAGSGRGPGRRR